MKLHIFVFLFVLFLCPHAHATSIVISEMNFDFSNMSVECSDGLTIDWDNNPTQYGNLNMTDYLVGSGFINENTYASDFTFTGYGDGRLRIAVPFTFYGYISADFREADPMIYFNFEMMAYTDSSHGDDEFWEYNDRGAALSLYNYTYLERESIYSGSLSVSISVNDGDIGTFRPWLHHELGIANTIAPVPEPATIILLGAGCLCFISRRKLSKN